LLIVHGGPGASHHYLLHLEELATEQPVIFYDQLGSGSSALAQTDQNLWVLPRFIDELGAVIAHLNLHEFHLLGHSWGGALVGAYALQFPQGIKTLIFASPLLSTPRWQDDANILLKTLPLEIQETITYHEQAGTTNSQEYQDAAQVFYSQFLCRISFPKQEHPFNVDAYLTMWGPSEFTATGNLLDFDILDQLPKLKMPVLITAGRFDEARPETMELVHKKINNATLAIFENSAHHAHREEPESYIQTLKSFLNKN
jgi:proline iminopeptidase